MLGFAGWFAVELLDWRREGNTDGKWFHQGRLPSSFDREMFPVNPGFQGPVNRLQKVVAVKLDVKADEVCPQHPMQKFPLPGADAEGFGIRPGNMPEKSDAGIRPLFFDQAGEQGKVIILDQNQGSSASSSSSKVAWANFLLTV